MSKIQTAKGWRPDSKVSNGKAVVSRKPKRLQSVRKASSVNQQTQPARNGHANGSEVSSIEPASNASVGGTALTLYLREVGRVNLLTPGEEKQLAAKVRKGNAEARDQMIRANLRLVVKIARDYDGLGVPLLDIINEGNIGLMSAVERFDPNRGAKLSTYASWWIRQSIRRALANQGKTIRLPVHMVERIYHMRQAGTRLQEVLGREPTDSELAAEMDLDIREIGLMRSSHQRTASLDAPLGDDESGRLVDLVRDESAASPYELLEEKNVNMMLEGLVQKLPEREASVLRYRFGLDGGAEKTLEEVGRKFGVTRERVRQLQNLALRKLRRMVRAVEAISAAA